MKHPDSAPHRAAIRQASDEAPVLAAFRRMGEGLRRAARSMLGNDEDVEDALQECFVRLWTRREKIPTEDDASALLTTTLRHLVVDELRRRKTRGDMMADRSAAADIAVTDAVTEVRETYEEVRRLVDRHLNALQRDILQRRDMQGESYADIARAHRMNEAAVRMQLSRARKIIREMYKKQHYEP